MLRLGLLCLLVSGLAAPAVAQHVTLRESASHQMVKPEALLRDMLAGRTPLVVDIRPALLFERGHIPGAVNVPHKQVPARWDEFAPYAEIGVILYGQRGTRFRYAAQALSTEGMRKVGVLEGFFYEWERRGYPVSRPEVPRSEE